MNCEIELCLFLDVCVFMVFNVVENCWIWWLKLLVSLLKKFVICCFGFLWKKEKKVNLKVKVVDDIVELLIVCILVIWMFGKYLVYFSFVIELLWVDVVGWIDFYWNWG